MKEYIYIKLVTGDDVLASKVTETSSTISIYKPLAIRNTIDADGSIKPASYVYSGLSNNNTIEVFKSSCIFVSELKEELKQFYELASIRHYKYIEDSLKQEFDYSSKTTGDLKDNYSDSIGEFEDTKHDSLETSEVLYKKNKLH